MNLFKKEFNYETPNKILEYLHSLKTTDDYNQATSIIEVLQILKMRLKICQKVMKQTRE